MYDTHDSVDDDRLEKYSVDSLENGELTLKSVAPLNKIPIRSNEPFYLHGKDCYLGPSVGLECKKLSRGTIERVLPLWNCKIDENMLISKGLQLNEDGSFSKSPRDKLPFIMPASKVARIRWKKQALTNQNSRDELPRKEERSLWNATNLKESGQGSNLVSNDQVSRLKTGENLTDSMKEALFKSYKKRRLQTRGNNAEKPLPKIEKTSSTIRGSVKGEQKSQEFLSKPKMNRSDLQLPLAQKTRLSYYERYQKKNGFNPESISSKGCKPPTDTVRCIFGDPARDALSEVSSEFVQDEEDDSEESFYERIITNEKCKGNSFGREEKKEEVESDRAKFRKDVLLKNVARHSPKMIVMSGRKSHRLCAIDPETLPKGELASKARAYGNLANTINMAKLQMKSVKLREDKTRASPASSSPSVEIKPKSKGSWEGKSFLPRLAGTGKKQTEVDLPWETRNLLMQISSERRIFKQNMNDLKNRITSKERICFEKNLSWRATVANG